MRHATARALVIAAILAAGGSLAPPACSDVTIGFRTAADSLIGIWTRDGQTGSVYTITTFGVGTVLIDCPGKFRAVGLLRGVELIALVRSPDAVGSIPAADVKLGMLRIADVTQRPLRVSFADRPGEKYGREQTWSFKSGFGQAPTATPADSLPKPGDYIYVEDLPEVVENFSPLYPEAARKKGIEGTVIVQVLVGKDGRVKNAQIANSVPELDASALACVRQWRFKPAMAKGEPIPVWVAVPVKYTLK